MVSFDYEDVIFLFNKWDILLEDDEQKIYFEDIKKCIRSIWKEIKFICILKFFMKKVNVYIYVFFDFKKILLLIFV